jgi:hypothetical protein
MSEMLLLGSGGSPGGGPTSFRGCLAEAILLTLLFIVLPLGLLGVVLWWVLR